MNVLTVVFISLGAVISPLAGSRTEVTVAVHVDKSSQFSFESDCNKARDELPKQSIPGLLRVTGWCTYVR
jgi:hypothetical protein